MIPSRSELKDILRSKGLRATAPRVAVFKLFFECDRPLAHSDVLQILGDDHWDQATLYRNLVRLTEVELLTITSSAQGIARYELKTDDEPHRHPHLVCKDCGSVECLPQMDLKADSAAVWEEVMTPDAEIQVLGHCSTCR